MDGDIRKKTLQPEVNGWAATLTAVLHTMDGRWVIEEQATGTPIGWICMSKLKPSPHPVIGFEVRRTFWNRGYATEAVNTFISHCFSSLPSPDALGSLVFVDNRASQRVFEKAGFREVGPHLCEGHPCLMYELTAEEWRTRSVA